MPNISKNDPLTPEQQQELRQALLQRLGGPNHIPVVEYQIKLTADSAQTLASIQRETKAIKEKLTELRGIQNEIGVGLLADFDRVKQFQEQVSAIKKDIASLIGGGNGAGELVKLKQSLTEAQNAAQNIRNSLEGRLNLMGDMTEVPTPRQSPSTAENCAGTNAEAESKWKLAVFVAAAIALVVIVFVIASLHWPLPRQGSPGPSASSTLDTTEGGDPVVKSGAASGGAQDADLDTLPDWKVEEIVRRCKDGNRGAFCTELKALRFDPAKHAIVKVCGLLTDERERGDCDEQFAKLRKKIATAETAGAANEQATPARQGQGQ